MIILNFLYFRFSWQILQTIIAKLKHIPVNYHQKHTAAAPAVSKAPEKRWQCQSSQLRVSIGKRSLITKFSSISWTFLTTLEMTQENDMSHFSLVKPQARLIQNLLKSQTVALNKFIWVMVALKSYKLEKGFLGNLFVALLLQSSGQLLWRAS